MEFQEVKLKDICIDMHQGINTVADKVEYKDNGFPIIQSKNITSNYLDLDDVRYLDEDDYLKYKDKYNPKIGDILVCNIGTIGTSLVLKKDIEFLIAWNLFKLKVNTDLYNSSYIKYYLDRLKSIGYFDRLTTGGTVKFINKTKMGDIVVPVFSLETQNKIVEVLDKAQELIDKRKEQIDALDELVKSRFIEMFSDLDKNIYGFDKLKMKDICSRITDGTHKTPKYINKGIKFISAKDIKTGKIDLSNTKYISLEEYNEIQRRCQLERGDILLSKSGSIGTPVVLQTDEPIGIFESLAVLKIEKNIINNIYLCEFLKSYSAQRRIVFGTKGISIKHLHLNVLKELEVLIPPMELQNQFADFVKQVDKLKSQMETSLKELEDNFNSLMQKAFKGELF